MKKEEHSEEQIQDQATHGNGEELLDQIQEDQIQEKQEEVEDLTSNPGHIDEERAREIRKAFLRDLSEDHIILPVSPELKSLFDRMVHDRIESEDYPEQSLTQVAIRMLAPFLVDQQKREK